MTSFIFWWTLIGVLVTLFVHWRSKGNKMTVFRCGTIAFAPLAIRLALAISGWIALLLILGILLIFRMQVLSFLRKHMAAAKKDSDGAGET